MDQGSCFALSERFGSCISLQPEICSRSGHEGYEIVGMNKFVPEARVGFGIEDLLEPIDDDLVSIRVTKLLVISKPEVSVVVNTQVDGNQVCAHRHRRGRQKAHACASFNGVENSDTGVRFYSNNAFQGLQSQTPGIGGIVYLRRMLYDQSVIPDLRKRRDAVEFAVSFRNKGIDV